MKHRFTLKDSKESKYADTFEEVIELISSWYDGLLQKNCIDKKETPEFQEVLEDEWLGRTVEEEGKSLTVKDLNQALCYWKDYIARALGYNFDGTKGMALHTQAGLDLGVEDHVIYKSRNDLRPFVTVPHTLGASVCTSYACDGHHLIEIVRDHAFSRSRILAYPVPEDYEPGDHQPILDEPIGPVVFIDDE